jgi:hypothetical protein
MTIGTPFVTGAGRIIWWNGTSAALLAEMERIAKAKAALEGKP